jgi:hypothetical protein
MAPDRRPACLLTLVPGPRATVRALLSVSKESCSDYIAGPMRSMGLVKSGGENALRATCARDTGPIQAKVFGLLAVLLLTSLPVSSALRSPLRRMSTPQRQIDRTSLNRVLDNPQDLANSLTIRPNL